MNTTTSGAVLDDARVIALATVARAGALLHGCRLEAEFLELARDGSMALSLLGGHDGLDVEQMAPGCLGDLGVRERLIVEACARSHAEVHGEDLAAALASLDGDRGVEVSRVEVARAGRVLAALKSIGASS